MNIYSNENIFKIKDNYHRLSESYNQIFPYRTRNFKLKKNVTLKASSLKFTNKLELYINQSVDISKIK